MAYIVLIISDVDPLCDIAPDLAEIAPSYEFVPVIIHGIELTLIHGKILNDDASKLSLIFPTLKEKSLFTIYGLQSRVDDN